MAALTRVERKILMNQYLILEQVDPANADSYSEAREILENGYEGEYCDIFRELSDGDDIMSEPECDFVNDVVSMHTAMQFAQKDGNSGRFGAKELEFPGFDSKQEKKFREYARHVMSSRKKWDSMGISDVLLDAGSPKVGKYQAMLREWNASIDKYILTPDDLERIVNAA